MPANQGGAVCQDLRIGGTWSENEKTPSNNTYSEIIFKTKIKSSYANSNRQQNGNDLCEQNGGTVRLGKYVLADWESRHHQDSSSWGLDPYIFQILMNRTIDCNVDLFANRLNTKLEQFISWLPDQEAIAHNALLHQWKGKKGL